MIVTTSNTENNLLGLANFAYRELYATQEEEALIETFAKRANDAIRALPKGAEEVTVEVMEEERVVLARSLDRMDKEGRGVLYARADPVAWLAALDSLIAKFGEVAA